MLELIIVRHAKTEHRRAGLSDHDRRLMPRGRADAKSVGLWLATNRLVPSVVLCSDSARTRQTVDLALKALGADPDRFDLRELYEADADDYARIVSTYAGDATRVLVVGHNPAVSDFVSRWAGSHVGLKPGALALLTTTAGRAQELDRATDLSLQQLFTPARE